MDPYRLQRFVDAQNSVYPQVVSELRAGRKQTHWMWFIFPQPAGLGTSANSRFYAISGLPEARAYFAHPILGSRLRECTVLVNRILQRSIEEIFSYPDHLKFRSSMELFAGTVPENEIFMIALEKYFPDFFSSEKSTPKHSVRP